MEALRRDGVVIVEELLDPEVLAAARDGLAPLVSATPLGRNRFSGSTLRFEDRGDYTLKGIEGTQRLFAVSP